LWNTGQRISDVIKFGTHNLKHDADGDWLAFTQQKTGKHLDVWINPQLQVIVAATKAGVFLRTRRGKPFTRHTMKDRFRVWCDEAGLPNCTSHGLRKASASDYASKPGTTATELMDHFGFSLRIAETYIKARNQKENNRRMQMRARGLAA
jgi:integrase